jgi:hypothetical protein
MSQHNPNLGPKPDTEDVVQTTTFERSDNRWDPQNGRRDWIVIAVLVVIYVLWMGTIYLFEPGIR